MTRLTIHQYPMFNDGEATRPATHWYAQSGGFWMAVVGEAEPDWFDGVDPAELPNPRTYPIDQLPPEGRLFWRYPDGTPIDEPVECHHTDHCDDCGEQVHTGPDEVFYHEHDSSPAYMEDGGIMHPRQS